MAGLLDNLPNRGTLLMPMTGSLLGSTPRNYVCNHDTQPPDHQVVMTDGTNILIRSLRQKNSVPAPGKKAAAKQKLAVAPGAIRATKRPAEGASAQPSKRRDGTAGEAGPSNASLEIYNKLQLESMRIPELQEVLRKRGLTVSGNKADLIVRILQAQAPQATRR